MIYVNQAKDGLRKIRAKRKAAQAEKGLGSSLAKAGFELSLRALSSEFCKKLINKALTTFQTYLNLVQKKQKIKTFKRH